MRASALVRKLERAIAMFGDGDMLMVDDQDVKTVVFDPDGPSYYMSDEFVHPSDAADFGGTVL